LELANSVRAFSLCNGPKGDCTYSSSSETYNFVTPSITVSDYKIFALCSGSNQGTCEATFSHTTFNNLVLSTTSIGVAMCVGTGGSSCTLNVLNSNVNFGTHIANNYNIFSLCDQTDSGTPECKAKVTSNVFSQVSLLDHSSLFSICNDLSNADSTCNDLQFGSNKFTFNEMKGTWKLFKLCDESDSSACTASFVDQTISRIPMTEHSSVISFCSNSNEVCTVSVSSSTISNVVLGVGEWNLFSFCSSTPKSPTCNLNLENNDYSLLLEKSSQFYTGCSNIAGSSKCNVNSTLDKFTFSLTSTDSWKLFNLCNGNGADSCKATFLNDTFKGVTMTSDSSLFYMCSLVDSTQTNCALDLINNDFAISNLATETIWSYVTLCDGFGNCTLTLNSNTFTGITMSFGATAFRMCGSLSLTDSSCTLTSTSDTFSLTSNLDTKNWKMFSLCESESKVTCAAIFTGSTFNGVAMNSKSQLMSLCNNDKNLPSTCSLTLATSTFNFVDLSTNEWTYFSACNENTSGKCTFTFTDNTFNNARLNLDSTAVTMCSQEGVSQGTCDIISSNNLYNFVSAGTSWNYFQLCFGKSENLACTGSFTGDNFTVSMSQSSVGWNFCGGTSQTPTCNLSFSNSYLNIAPLASSDWKYMSLCDGEQSGKCTLTISGGGFIGAVMENRAKGVSMCGDNSIDGNSHCDFTMSSSIFNFGANVVSANWSTFQFCYGLGGVSCTAKYTANSIGSTLTSNLIGIHDNSRFISACSINAPTFAPTCSVTLNNVNQLTSKLLFNGENAKFVSLCDLQNTATCTFSGDGTRVLGFVDLSTGNTASESTSAFYSLCNGVDTTSTCHFFENTLSLEGGLVVGTEGSSTAPLTNRNVNFLFGCQQASRAFCNVTLNANSLRTPVSIHHYTSFATLCGSGYSSLPISALGTTCIFNAHGTQVTDGTGPFYLGGRFFSACNPTGNQTININLDVPYGSRTTCAVDVSHSVISATMNVLQTRYNNPSPYLEATAFVFFGTVVNGARVNTSSLTFKNNSFSNIDVTNSSNFLSRNPFAVVYSAESNHIYSQATFPVFVTDNVFTFLNLYTSNSHLVSIGVTNSPVIQNTETLGLVSVDLTFSGNQVLGGYYNGPLVQYSRRRGNNQFDADISSTVLFKSNTITSIRQYYSPNRNAVVYQPAGPMFFFVSQPQADQISYVVESNLVVNCSTVVQKSEIPSLFGFFTSPKSQSNLVSTINFKKNVVKDITVDNLDALSRAYITFTSTVSTNNIWNNLVNMGLDSVPGTRQIALMGSAFVSHGFDSVTFSQNVFDKITGHNILLSFRSVNTLTVSDLTVSDCTAQASSLSTTMHLTAVINSQFDENTQFNNNNAAIGGAIYAEYSTVTLNGATFTGNTAFGLAPPSLGSAGTIPGSGGAVYMNGGSLLLPSLLTGYAVFLNCVANRGYGGAVYISYVPDLLLAPPSNLTNQFSEVSGTLDNFRGDFTSNSAGISGGAIYAVANTFNFGVPDVLSHFTGNTAEEAGGAVYLLKSPGVQSGLSTTTPAFFVNTIFGTNTAVGKYVTPTLIRSGSAVSSSRSLDFLNCNFTSNSLLGCVKTLGHPNDGTGAGLFSSEDIVLTDCVFSNQITSTSCPNVHLFAAFARVNNTQFENNNVEFGLRNVVSNVATVVLASSFVSVRGLVNHNVTLVASSFNASPFKVTGYAVVGRPDDTLFNTFVGSPLSVDQGLVDYRSVRTTSPVFVGRNALVNASTAVGSDWHVEGNLTMADVEHTDSSNVTVFGDFRLTNSKFTNSPVSGRSNGVVAPTSTFTSSPLTIAFNASIDQSTFVGSPLLVGQSAHVNSSTFDSTSNVVVSQSGEFRNGYSHASTFAVLGNYLFVSFPFNSVLTTGSELGASVGHVENVNFFGPSCHWVDRSTFTSLLNVDFRDCPFSSRASVNANTTFFDINSPVSIVGDANFIFGSSRAEFFVGGDSNISDFTFIGNTVNLASLTGSTLGGSTSLVGDTFQGATVNVGGPGVLRNNSLTDSYVSVLGGGTFSQQRVLRSNLEVGPTGTSVVSLSSFTDSSLIFIADGQVVSNTFAGVSNITANGGAVVTITKTMVPSVYCDSVSSVVNSDVATSLGGIIDCRVNGYTNFRVNPGVHLVVKGGSLGSPADIGSVFTVAQNGTLTIEGFVLSYTTIRNFGTVRQATDSELTMFDSNIENEVGGRWVFNSGATVINSASIIFTDQSLINAWFLNNGVVESFGRPKIGIKYSNTNGTMLAHVDSTNNIPLIIGDFTFTTPEVIFKNSTFIASDLVNIFNYSSFNALGTPEDPKGSFGLPYVPIITLAIPFNSSYNGYFDESDPNYADDSDHSAYVQYTYNNGNNQVPDRNFEDRNSRCREVGCPRIVMVNISDQNYPDGDHSFSNQLTLVANANSNIVTLLFFVILVIASIFSF